MIKRIINFCLLLVLFNTASSQVSKETINSQQLIEIKKQVAQINQQLWLGDSLTQVTEGESTEGGELTAYFNPQFKITKIKQVLFGELGRSEESYYLDSAGNPYFIQEQHFQYNRPMYAESGPAFKEKKTTAYAISFVNNQIADYAKYNGKRKFEKEKILYEEKIYWQGRCERFRTEMNVNSKEKLQERYRQIAFDFTGSKAMFCVKQGHQLFAVLNLSENVDDAKHLTAVFAQLAVVKLQWQPASNEWKKLGQAVLIQYAEKIEINNDYAITAKNGVPKLYFSCIVSNGKEKERQQKWVDLSSLSVSTDFLPQ